MKKSEIMEVTEYKAWESIKIHSLCSGPKPLYLQHFWQTPEGDTFISNSQSQGKKTLQIVASHFTLRMLSLHGKSSGDTQIKKKKKKNSTKQGKD